MKGCSSDPEAWEKYPVSQATSPTPFWARHPAWVKLVPKADLLLRIRKNKFPSTPCNPAPVTAVGLHNLASLLDRVNTHPCYWQRGCFGLISKDMGCVLYQAPVKRGGRSIWNFNRMLNGLRFLHNLVSRKHVWSGGGLSSHHLISKFDDNL